jgi:hypothetical protein
MEFVLGERVDQRAKSECTMPTAMPLCSTPAHTNHGRELRLIGWQGAINRVSCCRGVGAIGGVRMELIWTFWGGWW